MIQYNVQLSLGESDEIVILGDDRNRSDTGDNVASRCVSSFTPMEHLSMALGSCLLHFAQRYLARRGLENGLTAGIRCEVDDHKCEITDISVTITTARQLAAQQVVGLLRMLELCPVHKALCSTVPIGLEVASASDQDAA